MIEVPETDTPAETVSAIVELSKEVSFVLDRLRKALQDEYSRLIELEEAKENEDGTEQGT